MQVGTSNMCKCTHMHTRVHAYMCMQCTLVHTKPHVHMCACAWVCVYAHTYDYACMNTFVTDACTYEHVHTLHECVST